MTPLDHDLSTTDLDNPHAIGIGLMRSQPLMECLTKAWIDGHEARRT